MPSRNARQSPPLAAACVCVFAKPPRAGSVKTRLAGEVGAQGAARLARAFFADTWALVARTAWARPVAAVNGPFPLAARGDDCTVWRQGGGDLGLRMERVLRRALREAPFAIALGSDSPGLPRQRLEAARVRLAACDAVLGPAEDGGFYLLGLRRCPRGLLRELPWSSADTFARTCERLRARGLSVAILPGWFDVDRPADLARLRRLLAGRRIHAPHTRRALRHIDRPAPGR
jgi:hypothetical protein